ncbi:hypothetical protein KUCAC02_032370 [Chaenocephalus aceratus]|nr:hypothetical protein KUCAC02_032370 [Chaenocephalus aceratus]
MCGKCFVNERYGERWRQGAEWKKPLVVRRMEAVVLAIYHFHGVSYDPLPSPPAREKSESSFYGDRVSSLRTQDGARGAAAASCGYF